MKEYDLTPQGEPDRDPPGGGESDWIEFAALPVVSGKLRVSDPLCFRDLPPAPTFDVECGTYRVLAKTLTSAGDRRVSRLRAILTEPSALGPRLDDVSVDFAQVGIFDPAVLDEAGETMDAAGGEKLVADLDAVQEFGVVRLGPDDRAVMPLAASGFGDGDYPIHELLLDGRRVGVEVVFIGPEVPAD